MLNVLSFSFALGLLASTANASYAIKQNIGGFNATNGAAPDRLEINGFASRGGPAWDLFILCFNDLQARPQTQIDSYYQISGIHGRPYIAWDSVQSAAGQQAGGYCPHSSVLFPTWHRPYILLLEQQIWTCAQNLSQTYPTAVRQSYVSAAVTLRFPYWDWVKSASLPPIATQSSVTVNSPTGQTTVANPLFQYTFHPQPSSSDFPRNSQQASYPKTVRNPNFSGNSNNNAANTALSRNAGYLHDTTYRILTSVNGYPEFSNNGYGGSTTYGSIENPHGTVHNCVGGSGGHMTSLDYSSFDPVFWLHHTNVDRLIAIWQALHPTSFQIRQQDNTGTYAITSGTVETESTSLYPFSKDTASTYWTSTSARSTLDLGYTYPEIRSWGKTAAQNTADVKAAIRALYDPNGNLGRRARKSRRTVLNPRQTTPLNPVNVIIGGKYKQWAVNLEVDKFALSKSFNILFFVGKPGADSTQWIYDPALVATYPVNRPSTLTVSSGLIITGTIPLTRSLLAAVDAGKLRNLEVKQADPYLKQNLYWKLADFDGNEIKVEDVPSLKVFVIDQVVTPPRGTTDFPTYGQITPHLDVTQGKPGAASIGDSILSSSGISI